LDAGDPRLGNDLRPCLMIVHLSYLGTIYVQIFLNFGLRIAISLSGPFKVLLPPESDQSISLAYLVSSCGSSTKGGSVLEQLR